jgi:phosphate transport system permease protein
MSERAQYRSAKEPGSLTEGIDPVTSRRKPGEWLVEAVLLLAAMSSVGITLGIVGVLLYESAVFFRQVPWLDFLTDTQWTPLFADAHYGILPLLAGTLTTTAVALALALPVGTITAVFLSEYASARVREAVKPFLELLTSVPTVIFGYFALLVVTPWLQHVWPALPTFNMLSAGLVIGVMIIPYISSVSEDALHAVPAHIREGSLAMGATRMQTAFRVVVPSAVSGMAAAYVLGISRAIGETMVVAIAAGMQPMLTWNPLDPAATVTAYIVQVSLGDLPHGSLGYQTIFVAGLTLFVMTILFNVAGYLLRTRYHRQY